MGGFNAPGGAHLIKLYWSMSDKFLLAYVRLIAVQVSTYLLRSFWSSGCASTLPVTECTKVESIDQNGREYFIFAILSTVRKSITVEINVWVFRGRQDYEIPHVERVS